MMKSEESVSQELQQLRARVLELEQREQERERLEAALNEGRRLATLVHDVSVALIEDNTLQECLQKCAQSLIVHLDVAFARIWTLHMESQVLELQASAGMYTHLDGAHSRVPVGAFKIGLIAAKRQPHLTNSVIGDQQISDQQWAEREGMVAFAGYPLLVAGELVGVIALFARNPLSPAILDAMASVSNAIAIGIERKRVVDERAQALKDAQQAVLQAEAARVLREQILDNLPNGFMIFDEQWRYSYINLQARLSTGKPWQDLLGKIVWEEFPELIGSIYYEQYHQALLKHELVSFEIFSSVLSSWFEIHAYPIPGGLAVYFGDITARKRVEEERTLFLNSVEQARHEAEAALQVCNDFLSSVSHDLKTPLAVMRGNVQLLQRRIRRGLLEPAWSEERLVAVEAAIMKMNSMVDELLDVAKLQAGQPLDLDMHSVPLIPLLQRIRAEQQEITSRHQIVVQVLADDLFVRGDPIRLDRVFTNLLTNAIKYSPQGGHILIEIGEEEVQKQRWATVSIRDQGIGIPAADQARIFEPFYRASNVISYIQGTGVGLASVAQVIAQHGGSISVSSEEGQGSTFVIRLLCLDSETVTLSETL